jgi:hypothetical protein
MATEHGVSVVPSAGFDVIDDNNQSRSVVEAYPESGIRAYSVVFGCWCALLPASGILTSTGVLQAYVLEHQLVGHAESEVAWIFGVYAFLFFFGGLQAGMSLSCVTAETEMMEILILIQDRFSKSMGCMLY